MKKSKSTDNSSKDIIRHIGVLREHFDDKVGLIAEQYGSIRKKLDQHSEILNQHSEQFTLIRNELETIKIGLRHKVNIEDFEALEKRVNRLEVKLKAR